MFEEDPSEFSIAETVRAMAREVGGSLERMLDHLDIDEPAASFGINPEKAREWADAAGAWLREHVEEAGDEFATWVAGREGDEDAEGRTDEDLHTADPEVSPFRNSARQARRESDKAPAADPLHGAAPNPLDIPTAEQGQTLAALDSGRWTVEPGTETLAATRGEGPGPSDDALGLVRELRVRDWITVDGELTLAGRHALGRWLDAVA